MSIFDFITEERFRSSLESDYREMHACFDSNSCKAVHVLAGSIVEAVLTDHIVSQGIVDKKQALSLDLGKIISLCGDHKIISSRSIDLSSAIREYRNLIHPGRMIRLNEEITKDSAKVTISVVNMLIGEVSKKMKENYGYTAEQIVSKLERDSSAQAIIVHLLNETKPIEIERLMTKVLPARYLELFDIDELGDEVLPSFGQCFRKSFEHVDTRAKKRTMKWLVSVLKEKDEKDIISYATSFLRAADLKYLNRADSRLVLEHLLSRLREKPSTGLLDSLEGIGQIIQASEVIKFIDPLVRLMLWDKSLCDQAKSVMEKENLHTSVEIDAKISQRLKEWVDMFVKKGDSEKAKKVSEAKDIFDKSLPF